MSALHVRGSDGLFKDIKTIRGLSAYQVAVKEGFKGTEQEWLDSLKGEKGQPDKSLGMTAAQVGQIAKIKAIGPDGVPTEWEPVEIAGGGGGMTLIEQFITDGHSSTVDTDLNLADGYYTIIIHAPSVGDRAIQPYLFNMPTGESGFKINFQRLDSKTIDAYVTVTFAVWQNAFYSMAEWNNVGKFYAYNLTTKNRFRLTTLSADPVPAGVEVLVFKL